MRYFAVGQKTVEFLGKSAVLLLLVALLQSCASMSREECLNANWTVVGEIDGQRGRGLEVLDDYRRDCADYGVVPDVQAYVAGRDNGLLLYCTADNGYREGRNGRALEADCPPALAADFRRNFELGSNVHHSLSNLRISADTIRFNREELEELRARRTAEERSLERDTLTAEQAAAKRGEIASMSDRIDTLRDEITISAATLAVSLVRYRDAVGAARREGHFEPFEDELMREVQLFIR
ncbi:MAG: DUF2799 domain-containing protein [Gammaproteobacteria bacterium]|nr:DUF2799 domain-containing protein [Gammaproteobacteria bacterium]